MLLCLIIIAFLATWSLAALGLYLWWVAPANLSKYCPDESVELDNVDTVISARRRRGTRGKGRVIRYPEPITDCSLEAEAASLLIGVGRSSQIHRDIQSRLLAVAKIEGITINSVVYGPQDLSPTKDSEGNLVAALVSSARLLDAIHWSIIAAKNSDCLARHKVSQVATWVEDQMAHRDPHTLTGRMTQLRLKAEWKFRTSLGLDLPLPSQ